LALPDNGIAWPPKELEHVRNKYREYSSWYANDTAALGDMYAKGANQRGLLARIRTWFLGNKEGVQAEKNTIHVSLAQEICRTAANLLYSEPAKAVVVPPTEGANVEKVQERLDVIAGPEFEQLSISAAEISAALGGVYKRATWDGAVDHVFITKVDADMAWPEFRWGRLVAVTFWRTVDTVNQTVWRHLERHELDAQGVGVIIHGIYRGTPDNLGVAMGFADHPSMAWLTTPEMLEQLIDGNTLSTRTPKLGVVYAPNILPSALWRNDPVGANLGRSDLEGIEQKLDALDELYSSWLRDIRLGKGRLIVPEAFLRDLGAGVGAGFDMDQTMFTPVKAAPSSASSEKLAIEKVQFEIRTEDFLKAIDHFRRVILAAAGYSPSSFGLQDDGTAMTATEVAARQSLSFTTRKRKILGVKAADEAILTKALAMDAVLYPSGGAQPLEVSVEFPDGVQDDPKAVAEQNQMDFNSQSASIEERVRKRNPDWDDDLVDEEVARIKEETGVGEPLQDPEQFGVDGEGLNLDPSLTPTE
jgi:A118 family predicted phage portal protein